MNQFTRMSQINFKVENTLQIPEMIKIGQPKNRVGDTSNYNNISRPHSSFSQYSTVSKLKQGIRKRELLNINR